MELDQSISKTSWIAKLGRIFSISIWARCTSQTSKSGHDFICGNSFPKDIKGKIYLHTMYCRSCGKVEMHEFQADIPQMPSLEAAGLMRTVPYQN